MANEFVTKNGLISQNNTTVTGSLIVTNGITGSLRGTASWATNAINATNATTATNATYATYGEFANNILINTQGEDEYSVPLYSLYNEGEYNGLIGSNMVYSSSTNTLIVTASYATQALTASYAVNAGSGGGGGTDLGLTYAISIGYFMP